MGDAIISAKGNAFRVMHIGCTGLAVSFSVLVSVSPSNSSMICNMLVENVTDKGRGIRVEAGLVFLVSCTKLLSSPSFHDVLYINPSKYYENNLLSDHSSIYVNHKLHTICCIESRTDLKQ